MAPRIYDTLNLARAVGPWQLSMAVLRRAFRVPWAQAKGAVPTGDRLVRALSTCPSPLFEEDEQRRLGLLDAELPGASARIRERAHAALENVSEPRSSPTLVHSDPRLLWEPARLGRWVKIGLGVRVARTRAEADFLRSSLEYGLLAFIESHPPPGPGWESPLEVALRAFSLWLTLSLARPAMLRAHTLSRVGGALFLHARHVAMCREDTGLVVGSHLLGELVGLYASCVALSEGIPELSALRSQVRRGLTLEARRQILPDGGGTEGSTGYTRFVAELWLAVVVIARAEGAAPPDGALPAARALLRFLGAAMAPDGTDLRIGDDDDSQVLPASQRGAIAQLLPLGSALAGDRFRLERVTWSEEAAWLGGTHGYLRFRRAAVRGWPSSFSARDFGLHVARGGPQGGDLVALRAGPYGQGGAGGHAHNDALSISVWWEGRPVIADPGTGIYLGRPALRDRFRGVAAHSTLTVDGHEPSPIPSTRPFALPDHARARARVQALDPWRCVGEHHGFAHLGIAYRREVRFDRVRRLAIVVDHVIGAGEARTLVLSFPLAGEPAEIVAGSIRVGPPGQPLAWLCDGDAQPMAWRLDPGFYSPHYGEIVPGWIARRVGRVRLPVVLVTRISRDIPKQRLTETP